jgi:hypothetical protein
LLRSEFAYRWEMGCWHLTPHLETPKARGIVLSKINMKSNEVE